MWILAVDDPDQREVVRASLLESGCFNSVEMDVLRERPQHFETLPNDTVGAGLVVMGYSLMQKGAAGSEIIASDPEQVLPVVLGQFLPAGVRGVVIAGLIAAAMSTFDSTLNAGASYIVKDVYETYINPGATGKDLMRVSRWATVGLCVGGIALAAIVPNINKIWGLITMGLGAGLFVPLFLRWYWPRFNGYGFAAGTAAGIVAGLSFNGALSWPVYTAFPAIIGTALAACVVVTYMTPPVADDILVSFWVKVSPWGMWGDVSKLAIEQGEVDKTGRLERLLENLNDLVALAFAVPFQLCTLVAGMAFIFHDWKKFSFMIAGSLFSGVGLYFMWYRNLKSEEQCAADDAKYAPLREETEEEGEPAPEPAAAE